MFKFFTAPFIRGLLFVTASLLLTACGLPSLSVTLDPPTDVELRTPDSTEMDLRFRNAHENGSSIFSGYEVYYKIYDPLDDSTEGAANLYEADREKISSFGISADYTDLVNLQFRRLHFTEHAPSEYAPGDSNFPHSESYPAFSFQFFSSDPNFIENDFRIRFKLLPFSSPEDIDTTYLAESYDSEYAFDKTPYFYRWVGTSDSLPDKIRKGFGYDDFDISDSDLPDTIDDADIGNKNYVYISFFILSFGRDVEKITPIYSEPVYLGTLKFDCLLKNER